MSGRVGQFYCTETGAVYEDSGCRCYSPYDCEGWSCGKELIGFLPHPDIPEPQLLPSSLWDFSAIDYLIR